MRAGRTPPVARWTREGMGMVLPLVALAATCATLGCLEAAQQVASVVTRRGLVAGTVSRTSAGTEYYRFRGLPYARHRRFQISQLENRWGLKILDATQEAPLCPQVWKGAVTGAEDCLTLSIMSPKINHANGSAAGGSVGNSPVLVIINGDHFVGDAMEHFDPSAWMDEGVVVVKVQYRLGALGFFTTEDQMARGNYGLHDVVVALTWIRQTIGHFGGDANLITLLGIGSGSALVYDLYLSPATLGLFSRAVCTSNPPTGTLNFNPALVQLFQGVAAELDCLPASSSFEVTSCLRLKSASEIVMATHSIQRKLLEGGDPWFWVTPSSEATQSFAIVPTDPASLLLSREPATVPIMIGWGQDEGLALLKELHDASWLRSSNGSLVAEDAFKATHLPFLVNFSGIHSADEADQLKYLYYESFFRTSGSQNSRSLISSVGNLLTTVLWEIPLLRIAEHLASHSVPVNLFLLKHPAVTIRFQEYLFEGAVSAPSIRKLFAPSGKEATGQEKRAALLLEAWKKEVIRLLADFMSPGSVPERNWPLFRPQQEYYMDVGPSLAVRRLSTRGAAARTGARGRGASDQAETSTDGYQVATWTLLVFLLLLATAVALCTVSFRGKSSRKITDGATVAAASSS